MEVEEMFVCVENNVEKLDMGLDNSGTERVNFSVWCCSVQSRGDLYTPSISA